MNNDPTLTDPSTTTGHSLLLNENESIFNFKTIPLSTTFSSRLNKRKAKSISDNEVTDSTQNKSHTNKSNKFTENLAPNHSFAENLTRPIFAQLCRTQSIDDLLFRISTFKNISWSIKHEALNPINCSLHGWINSGMNRLECLSCASILLIDPSSVDTDYHYDVSLDSPIDDFADELYNKNEFMVKIFTDQLSSAHKPDCLWHSTCCKPELYGPVSETARTQLVKLNNTVKSMLLLPSKTPLASLSTPPSVSESPENPSFLPHISLPKDLAEKYGTKIDSIVSKITPMLDDPLPADTFKRPRIQPSTSSPSLPNSSPVYTACVLALFGWIPQEISNLQYLKCNLCFRSIPLTCYSKLNKQKTKPHGSTSDGCTEHKDRNAVDNEGGSVDHLKSFDVIGNHRIYCYYADKSTDTTESNPFSSENQLSYYNSRVFQTLDRLSI